MPRHRQKDFRSGDLAEAMGILLLKGVAAVAEVARTEDVGIDAVATLLRPGPDDLLIAEDSFFVQVKSSSVRRIDYDRQEIQWLKELRLPFFIASIDKKASKLSLYSTNRLAGFFISTKDPDIFRLQLHKTKTTSGLKMTEIYIGPPVASWTIADLSDAKQLEQVYRVIKAHIAFEQRNIAYRSINYFFAAFWSTNDEKLRPVLGSGMEPKGGEITPILSQISPHLSLAAGNCHQRNDVEGLQALQKMAAWMKSNGVETGPGGALRHWLQVAIAANQEAINP